MEYKNKLRVVDFFSGAGGFSEGFRQQGFDVVMGVDYWQPAIDSHNLNHNLHDSKMDVLDFWGEDSLDIEKITNLPDSEFIVGSPSCVSFSMSNRSGKGDKTLGIKLIESYLRVVAVKKYQKNSILKGWYMENVPQSRKYVNSYYTFKDLNLGKWARSIGKKSQDIALNVDGDVLNAGDFGAPQGRKRFIAGEWISNGKFLAPQKTRDIHITVSEVRRKMPSPRNQKNKMWIDPNYPNLRTETKELTDHFYDTGLYEIEWEKAQYLKINHPFMGKMSFPENENRVSRTITATRSGGTRESLIYKSEYNRKGSGEFRLPTIREISCLMGFPYSYQFVGSEGVKWKQIGNSVCPHMSAALAKAIRKKMHLAEIKLEDVDFTSLGKNFKEINNLTLCQEKSFDRPRGRKENARFRRHPIKIGNMTVDLMNYHPVRKEVVAKNWYLGIFFGTGDNHDVKVLRETDFRSIHKILQDNFVEFTMFKKDIEKNITTKIKLQKIYEEDIFLKKNDNPVKIVKRLGDIIRSYDSYQDNIEVGEVLPKKTVPMAQLMAVYGLSRFV